MIMINRMKYAEIGRKMRALPHETPGASYEWEELVHKLCASVDTQLHEIGSRERDKLKQKLSTIS